MNPTDPKTPRTDAAAAKNLEQFPEGFTTFKPDAHVDADFARTIETELTQAQAETAAMRAERDELRGKLNRECSNHDVTRDVLIEADGREIRLMAERDAANALVEAIKQEADKLHSECIRDGETDAYCLTSERIAALAEVAKSLSPRTTENTKPQ